MISISLALFVLLLVFCPVAFGTVELWSIASMEFLAPLTLLAYLLCRESRKHWYAVPGLWPFALLIGFMGVQLLHLPFDLLRSISPKAAYMFEPVHAAVGRATSVPLSLDSKATLQEVVRFSSYLMVYVVAIQLLSDYRRLRKTLLIVVGLAGGIAFLAILQKFSSPDCIYWFRSVPNNAKPFGPWVSRNHFAGFMEMVIPLGTMLALHHRPYTTYKIPLRERFVSFFALPNANLHILLSFAVILMVTALFMSLSRGGILSSLMSILVLVVLLALMRQGRRSLLALAALAVAVLLLISWLGWQPIVSRFDLMMNQEGYFTDSRLLIWQDTIPMVKDFLIAGAGFGSFEAVYPYYKKALEGGSIVDHAHNDFIELLTDGGVVAMVLAGCFLWSVISCAWKRVCQRHDPFATQLFCGAIAAIVAILLHSLTDFNMHNPANGLYFFLLCGVVVSAANSRRRWERQPTYLVPASQRSRLLTIIPVLGVFMGGLLLNAGQFAGAAHYQKIKDIYLNTLIPAERLAAFQKTALMATSADPFHSDYQLASAKIATFLQQHKEAEAGYLKALLLKPTSARNIFQIGRYFESLNPAVAQLCFERTPLLDRFAAGPLKLLARHQLKNGDTEGGFSLLRQAYAAESANRFDEYLALLQEYNFGLIDMESILPERVGNFLKLADYLVKKGQQERARMYYRKALTFLDNEPKMQTWFFLTPYAFFQREKQYGDALAVIREGIKRMPEDPILHIKAGDSYVREGVLFKAKEEYAKALTIAPDNQEAAAKLGNVTSHPP